MNRKINITKFPIQKEKLHDIIHTPAEAFSQLLLVPTKKTLQQIHQYSILCAGENEVG